MKLITRIFSFIALFALCLALSGKTIHVLTEHHDEELCSETITHFHEQEHSCFICEFDFQQADEFNFVRIDFTSKVIFADLNLAADNFTLQSFHELIHSRGPPAV